MRNPIPLTLLGLSGCSLKPGGSVHRALGGILVTSTTDSGKQDRHGALHLRRADERAFGGATCPDGTETWVSGSELRWIAVCLPKPGSAPGTPTWVKICSNFHYNLPAFTMAAQYYLGAGEATVVRRTKDSVYIEATVDLRQSAGTASLISGATMRVNVAGTAWLDR